MMTQDVCSTCNYNRNIPDQLQIPSFQSDLFSCQQKRLQTEIGCTHTHIADTTSETRQVCSGLA